MSSERLYENLIVEAAQNALVPLGFQRKSRSRTWFADQGWWLVVAEFQPSAGRRGAFLNVGAKWLWRGDDVWSLDFSFHPAARAANFEEFENESQFRDASSRLAQTAVDEARRLREAFRSIHAVAELLRERAAVRADGWDLYHAGVAAFLAGRSNEAHRYFTRLSVPMSADSSWLVQLRVTARALADMCGERQRLSELLKEQLHRSRAAMRLRTWNGEIPGASLHAV
jgi:hypothetical protein